ncbi:TetR/AcrR family transcriptional regulator [Prescottella equi]|uniref:TetR family transcriptional regulator n=1 Tax=Rhodococcus hoagii TaxID=43767 RepID=A0AAE4ZHK8_RHOHA|nr:TetR/AcrR family transcriptional regulator [Prescottella equi]MCD7050468.1 TetR/AcrR family transcriptional regulator [Rhodococcus sp. BH2-1]MBM4493488.1 TetR family transcriptional regulator [Prescottella equi]MBM4537938.1 TetR family transcriptional regulator [Prescottella equi]MBM4538712.1 TetR family transcriptional regulator [Prescottella equi]MBM4716803.1 TetR family transcriptional regulator [Prescottella equi]
MASTRREEILFHAAKLFSERGVAGTTVRDIADEVGILSGSLYHYFGSKDAIVFEIVIAFVDDLNERYEATQVPGETGRERIDHMVAVSFEAAADHPFATEIYQNESALSSQPEDSPISVAVRRAHDYWADAISRGVRSGEFRVDIDQQHFHRMLRESVWSTVRFNRASLAQDAERLRHDLIAVFLDGFAAGGPVGSASAKAAPGPVRRSEIADRAAAVELPGADDSEFDDLRRDVRELKEAIRELRLLRGN